MKKTSRFRRYQRKMNQLPQSERWKNTITTNYNQLSRCNDGHRASSGASYRTVRGKLYNFQMCLMFLGNKFKSGNKIILDRNIIDLNLK